MLCACFTGQGEQPLLSVLGGASICSVLPSPDDATRKLRSGSRDQLLRVEGLSTYFALKRGWLRRTVGQIRAVDGVDLRVLRGQTVAVVGEAGAGKSTMARTLLGSVDATSGKLLFEGKDLLALGKTEQRRARRHMQCVLPEMLAVAEPLAALRALLEVEPKLLILDEPFGGLPYSVRLSLFEELRSQQYVRGFGCLLLTRELEQSAELADEVAIMHAGQIVETGAAAGLVSQPRHPYTQAILAALAPPPAGPPRPARAEPSPQLVGCRFEPRCPRAFGRCAEAAPPLFAVAGGLSRCFLHDPGSADDQPD